MWYICTKNTNQPLKSNEVLIHATIQMSPVNITITKRNEIQKATYSTHILNALFRQIQNESKLVVARGSKEQGMEM